MTETELDQVGPIEGRPRLFSPSPDDNLSLRTASDVLSDEEIEPAVLDQIQH